MIWELISGECAGFERGGTRSIEARDMNQSTFGHDVSPMSPQDGSRSNRADRVYGVGVLEGLSDVTWRRCRGGG